VRPPPARHRRQWNFAKFLVNAEDGSVIERFAPTTTPDAIAPYIEKALA
jgi:glutathione peroxidase